MLQVRAHIGLAGLGLAGQARPSSSRLITACPGLLQLAEASRDETVVAIRPALT